jgi:hypothetical protein
MSFSIHNRSFADEPEALGWQPARLLCPAVCLTLNADLRRVSAFLKNYGVQRDEFFFVFYILITVIMPESQYAAVFSPKLYLQLRNVIILERTYIFYSENIKINNV